MASFHIPMTFASDKYSFRVITFYNTKIDVVGPDISDFFTWPRGYITFFMLSSVEHEIFPAPKC